MSFCSCALLVLAASQSPAPTERPATEAEWIELDHVVLIVNQDILTYRALVRDLKAALAERPTRDKSEMQQLQSSITTRRTEELLAKQAGRDMGFDEKLVERNVADRFEGAIATNSGVVGLSNVLQAKSKTPEELRDDIRERLYGRLWIDAVTGQGAGLTERPSRDRYVRPGQLRFRYERALGEPKTLQALGGGPELVRVQTLNLDPDAHGGLEATIQLAAAHARAIAEGADMTELVREHGAVKTNDGIGEPVELARLRSVAPALGSFIDARPSDPARWPGYVSAPTVVGEKAGKPLVQIARIHSITPPRAPEFGTIATQNAMSRLVQDDLDRYRLERGFSKLYRAAYVWTGEDENSR